MKDKKAFRYLFVVPVSIYSLILILLPLIYILFLSFCSNDSYGGIIYNFTLANSLTLFNLT